MDEDRRSHDVFGFDGADGNNFLNLGDGRFCGHGHDGIEISGGQSIGEIAELIGLLSFDEGEIGVDGEFENAALSFEDALFLAFGDFRADAHGGVETLEPAARMRSQSMPCGTSSRVTSLAAKRS